MAIRKTTLAIDGIYHIYNRGIDSRVVFDDSKDYDRFIALLEYQRVAGTLIQYSRFLNRGEVREDDPFEAIRALQKEQGTSTDILAYCLMPNHFHLILRQTVEDGISAFLQKLCNGYAKYYNQKARRSGPLWEGRFKSVEVSDDGQLQHLSRYIHLNPVTARLAEKPEDWKYSSYREYTQPHGEKSSPPYLCRYQEFISLKPAEYAKFVTGHIDSQRELHLLKKSLLA